MEKEEEAVEEGFGESSSASRSFADELDAHFSRFPSSYVLDVSVDRAKDVELHRKMLEDAKDPCKLPVFHVRFLKYLRTNLDADDDLQQSTKVCSTPGRCENKEDTNMTPNFSVCGIDIEPCTKLEDLNLNAGKNASYVEDRRQDGAYTPVHEIIFSTLDKPKLLSKGIDGLHKELKEAIARIESSWFGASRSSAKEKMLAVQPEVGEWEIEKSLLKMGQKIASGSSGDLHRGTYMGQDVAIKVISPEHLKEALGIEFAQEVMILRKVQHRNIVCFIGICTKPPQLCIVTEYMPGGSLYDFLHKHNNVLELPLLLKFAIDISKGMEYLHQNNIIHRDLKTANLLMDANHVVKVSDFGVARFQSQGVMTAETGTYRWMAPEVINHQSYDQKADVFSFAIVLWELATSKIPYDTMTPLQAALGVRQGLRPELPGNADPRLLDLMQRCWDAKPANRPSFLEITAKLEELLGQVETNL